jgi:hypothetical protein
VVADAIVHDFLYPGLAHGFAKSSNVYGRWRIVRFHVFASKAVPGSHPTWPGADKRRGRGTHHRKLAHVIGGR